jgi:hypothetical protein
MWSLMRSINSRCGLVPPDQRSRAPFSFFLLPTGSHQARRCRGILPTIWRYWVTVPCVITRTPTFGASISSPSRSSHYILTRTRRTAVDSYGHNTAHDFALHNSRTCNRK